MTRSLALALLVGFLLLVVTGLGVVVALNRSDIVSITSTAAAQRQQLRSDEKALARQQAVQQKSQKASTQTRVSTVTQRCELTRLILRVLIRVHDTVDAAPFHASEHTCLKQLATVKAINAATPSAPVKPKPKAGPKRPAR